jgi:ERCC4-type nuclease
MVKLKLLCEENEFLMIQLENSRKQLVKAGQDQKAQNAKRIIQALQVFPLPVKSGKMAEELLRGTGPWWAGEMEKWLKTRPEKRKATPVKLEKKIPYLPQYESIEWACLMCLSFEAPILPYDVAFLAKKYLNYMIPETSNVSDVFEKLNKIQLVQCDEEGAFCLTPYGISVIPKIQHCLTVKKTVFETFDPESWIFEHGENKENQEDGFLKDFQIVLIVDAAERLSMDFSTIATRLSFRDLLVEKKKLWIGDYQWVCRTKVKGKVKDFSLGYVVERKTADDLAHSIVDYRYDEQKIKMKLSQANCFYLLEGTVPKGSNKITSTTLINSLLSTKFNFGFQIKITKDATDSLNWLARMTSALYQKVSKMSSIDFQALQTFEEFQSETNPNEGRTVNEVFGKQLRALDDVGEQSTLAILKSFSTPLQFYQSLKAAKAKGQRSLNNFLKSVKMSNGYSIQKKTRQLLVDLFLG